MQCLYFCVFRHHGYLESGGFTALANSIWPRLSGVGDKPTVILASLRIAYMVCEEEPDSGGREDLEVALGHKESQSSKSKFVSLYQVITD